MVYFDGTLGQGKQYYNDNCKWQLALNLRVQEARGRLCFPGAHVLHSPEQPLRGMEAQGCKVICLIGEPRSQDFYSNTLINTIYMANQLKLENKVK